jgi:hypothetical protein
MSGTPGRIVIEGHGDARGTPAGSRALGERRAAAVRDFLVARGVSRDLFAVQAAEPDQPVADSGTVEARAANRRVEIVLPRQPAARPGTEPAIPGPPAPAAPATTTPTFPLPRPPAPRELEVPAPPPPAPDLGPAPIPGVPRP